MEYPVIDSSHPHSQILFFLRNIQCSCGNQMYTVFFYLMPIEGSFLFLDIPTSPLVLVE